MSGLFCIADLSEVDRKNIFLILWYLTPSKINEVIYSHNKCWDKSVLVGKTLKLTKRQKAKKKKKRELKFAI